MKAVALSLCALALVACGADRLAELDVEMKKLEKERVPFDALEKARAEADDAEASLAALRDSLAASERLEAQSASRRDALHQDLARERAELEADGPRIEEARQAIAHALDETKRLDAEVASVREGARLVRDQAAALERQLRPGDAAWATERRLTVLDEFLKNVAGAYPDDPIAKSLAREKVAEGGDVEARAAAGRARAARLRDRFTRVYALDEPATAVGTGPGEGR